MNSENRPVDLTIEKSTGPEKERENLAKFSPNEAKGCGTEVHSQNAKPPEIQGVLGTAESGWIR